MVLRTSQHFSVNCHPFLGQATLQKFVLGIFVFVIFGVCAGIFSEDFLGTFSHKAMRRTDAAAESVQKTGDLNLTQIRENIPSAKNWPLRFTHDLCEFGPVCPGCGQFYHPAEKDGISNSWGLFMPSDGMTYSKFLFPGILYAIPWERLGYLKNSRLHSEKAWCP